MNITFRQLKAFASVARHQSFTKAADELHLTQSSLSGLIKEMEKQLDARLFDRTTRQLRLSDAGLRLLPHALRVLDNMQLLDDEIGDLKDFEQGKVRIAVPQQLAASVMPVLIKAFKQQHPDILVTIIDCMLDDVVASVQHGDADLGLDAKFTLPNELTADILFEAPFCLVVPPEHPLARHTKVTWDRLCDGELITLQSAFARQISSALAPELSSQLFRADYQVNFLSTALAMVKMGLGRTVALDYTRPWVTELGLTMLPIEAPVIHHQFMLYKHRERKASFAVEIFERFLKVQSAIWTGDYSTVLDV